MLDWRVVAGNVRVGVDALRIHPLRTMLSVLGITIGSAALVATMAVSDGMMQFARDKVQRQTAVQVVVVSPRTSAYVDGQWVAVHDYPRFDLADAEAIAGQIPGVEAVSLLLSGRTTARFRGAEHRVDAVLGTSSLPDFGTLEIGAGRFFSETEAADNLPVVVVNYALARELMRARDPFTLVGCEIHVHDHIRRVIGILAPTGFEDRSEPSFAVYAPIVAAAALLDPPPGGRFAPALQLRAPDVESVEDLRDAASDWLSRRYTRWQERVRVSVGLEQLQRVEQIFLVAKVFIGALVGISLLVGGIGIMNVLLASVTERTREIGIRKSVGARRADIRAQFLTESVAIALAGAGAGLVVGMLMAVLVTAAFRHFAAAPIHPSLSPGSVLIATLSSSIVGLVFGTYPAETAAALSPVIAIARE